jgi:hypothetical protein
VEAVARDFRIQDANFENDRHSHDQDGTRTKDRRRTRSSCSGRHCVDGWSPSATRSSASIADATDNNMAPLAATFETSDPAIRKAHRTIGIAMGTCLGMWFLPLVSGLIINLLERNMIRSLLKTLDGNPSEKAVTDLFWFFRGKLFALYAATYTPWVGTAFQLFEVYALGQFVVSCASRCRSLGDDRCMLESWRAVEQEIFSGDRAVTSYEQWTGKKFPARIKGTFVSSVDHISTIYRAVERAPGAEATQEILARILRKTAEIAVEASARGIKSVGRIGRNAAKPILIKKRVRSLKGTTLNG